ncbi:DUF4166 domain-containing protein [Nocardia sp. 004]|uniref:DUF4166 domain-containing protein n=1 Tax=Nocardia sp. 004 TaxID=3385978 RepID=UPI00399F8C41
MEFVSTVDVCLPLVAHGRAEARERFDDTSGRFRTNVQVTDPLIGPVFGSRGTFTAGYVDARAYGLRPVLLPLHAQPRR